MKNVRALVTVVGDDDSVREALPELLRELGFAAASFPSGREFLDSEARNETQCLILDIAMPGMSGPAVQEELTRLHLEIPIVFITGTLDSDVRPRLLDRGAVECLFKPFDDATLLEAIAAALRGRARNREMHHGSPEP